MKSSSDLTIAELKEKLRARKLPTAGSKLELMQRLQAAELDEEPTMAAREIDTVDRVEWPEYASAARGDTAGLSASAATSHLSVSVIQKEVELCRREKELVERELVLAQREIELLRQERTGITAHAHETAQRGNCQSVSDRVREPLDGDSMGLSARAQELASSSRQMEQALVNISAQETPYTSKVSVASVAELLNCFDGTPMDYDVWEGQVKLLRDAYNLNDGMLRILISMRLKGRAGDWFHSRPEHLSLSCDDLLRQMRQMFHFWQSKLTLRKKFEERKWNKSESIREYVHDKIILGNQVSISDDEILDYIIEGIPDVQLRDQARIQSFTDTNALIRAFEKISLNERPYSIRDPAKQEKRDLKQQQMESRREGQQRRATKRCLNCGEHDHLGVGCPTKSEGVKCFKCGERGHIASKCVARKEAKRINCAILHSERSGCDKEVMLGGNKMYALIDTGSSISLMSKAKYYELDLPSLNRKSIHFRGIGANVSKTLGFIETDIEIDGHSYTICIHIIPTKLALRDLLIGKDFIIKVEVNVRNGYITISPPKDEVSEVLSIQAVDEVELNLPSKGNEYREEIEKLIDNYVPSRIRESDLSMTIVVKDDEPVYQRARRLSMSERELVNKQIDEWIKEGIVQPSISEYASPIVIVKKKDGNIRVCVDYRKLNQKIVKDRYPLPLIEDQIDALQGAKIFSTLDLKNGFFHVPVEKSSRKFTAFIVPDGTYEFLRVPFGLCNSPAIFQKYINTVFRNLIKERVVLIYMDDLIIPSNDSEGGMDKLKRVLQVASEAGLQINWKKCAFLQSEVEFLGYTVSNGSIRPSECKSEAIKHFSRPTSVRQLQRFIGLTSYFRKFIRNYAHIARPLTDLLKANVEFRFGEAEQNAFSLLKTLLTERPVLSLYRVGAITELHTDASKYGYGAILLQRDTEDQMMHPVYYASGRTTSSEENYPSYELEVLAVIKALTKFRVYLLGIPFTIVTDCQAFALTMSKKNLCVRVARWILLLEEFQYTVEHRPGKSMAHVDALSRNPLPVCLNITECEDSLMTRLKKAQAEDPHIHRIIESVKQGKTSDFLIQGDLLFKTENGCPLLIAPTVMQSQIIRNAHEKGHFSVAKTEALLKKEYWMTNMRPKIEKVVRNCIQCILAEKKHGKQEGFLNSFEKGSTPLDTYHLDHMGPLPTTQKRYRYIFAIVDAFTKYVWLYPTRTTNAFEVIGHLRKQAVVFGSPRRVISDRGSAFISSEFEEYCKQENIFRHLITTGVPRANGQIERINKVLIPLLTKLAAPKPQEWFKYLDRGQQCINTTWNRSTGTTPFRLLFGVHPRLKNDLEVTEAILQEMSVKFDEERDEMRETARENILKIQSENKKQYDRKRKKPMKYQEDDLVAIKRTQRGPGLKLANQYLGPYQITRTLRNDRYLVRKVGEHEGPMQTSTAADFIKPWLDYDTDYPVEEEVDIRGECSSRMAECRVSESTKRTNDEHRI